MRIALALLILIVSLSASASGFDEMKALAEAGDEEAQFNLASMIVNGVTLVDISEAQ